MTSRLAAWLFRKLVEKHVIGFIYVGEFEVPPGSCIPPMEVEVLFDGR